MKYKLALLLLIPPSGRTVIVEEDYRNRGSISYINNDNRGGYLAWGIAI